MCVRAELRPGLLEEAYTECLAAELTSRGFRVLSNTPSQFCISRLVEPGGVSIKHAEFR